jgi:hypothetical protein
MYGKYLAPKLPLYLTMGILCSILLGINLTIMKYNRSLEAINERIGTLDVKKIQMKKDRDQVALRVKEFQRMRPERFWDAQGDEFILKAVDNLRARTKGDVLEVANVNRGPTELTLPIEFSFNFDTYGRLLRRLYDLDRMAIPFFQFTSFSFHKEQPDRALCRIQGNIVMPAAGGGR